MDIPDLMSYMTEERLRDVLDQFRSFGPLPGIALTFLKSFIPPLPTLLIVGVNAAVYGLWLGFLYSWIGMVAGCLVTFLVVRRVSEHRYLRRWAEKPKVQKSMRWIRRNAFSYVFLLSLFPVGPFVIINIAAGLARMPLRSFLLAVLVGKGIMVLLVSYIGHDLARFVRNPWELLYVVAFVGVSLWLVRAIEARFSRRDPLLEEPSTIEQAGGNRH
ncbi:TVP38/TMEM64 family protein [Paenibacillus sp. HJGM_3]|uniref:TVP38/TMEM64 family protein n=1 Tax=Paenibacillus sp. HJGM_3 TaxID=3379816 RepID=UPI00385E2DC8